MNLRVGRIPFLVCAPFFHDFLGREGEYREFDFVDGPPSAHCAGLMDGSIHLSPASSITFALKPGAFVLSPSLCTSCSFEVRSVKLFSHYPIEKLGGRGVRITSQSRTSVALLRILLEMRYGLKPAYVQGLAAEDGDDACLLIGDLALEENERGRFEFSYDLGSLWQEWQGLPFVFGAWIISKAAAQKNRAGALFNAPVPTWAHRSTAGLLGIRYGSRATWWKITTGCWTTASPKNASSPYCFSSPLLLAWALRNRRCRSNFYSVSFFPAKRV